MSTASKNRKLISVIAIFAKCTNEKKNGWKRGAVRRHDKAPQGYGAMGMRSLDPGRPGLGNVKDAGSEKDAI